MAVLLLSAQTGAAAGSCPTSEPALQTLINSQSTVDLRCPGATTIPLTSTISVSSGQSVTLDASGSPGRVTLDGGGAVELFSVSGGSLTLKGLTLARGHGSGALAGAIQNSGTLSVVETTLSANSSSNGAAIVNSGTATITRSALVGDTGGDGGAVLNQGTLTIAGSTFNRDGAGLGGGLFNSGTSTITNSTLAGNFGDRGAAIYNAAGTVSIAATIISDAGAENCSGGGLSDRGYNLEDDAGASCGFSAGRHDIVGQDPRLGGLAENGGPTPTMAVPFASPAVDEIPTSSGLCPATDQRGQPRPDRGESVCDIGAYENQSENACAASESQLEELIGSGKGPIALSCPTPTAITITQTLTLTKNVTIDASASPGVITLKGAGAIRLFVNFANLKLVGLVLSGGHAGSGGAIYNEGSGTVTIANETLTSNSAVDAGGAIWNGGTLSIIDSTLDANTAGMRGGAVETSATGRTTISNSTLTANTANDGGAVDNRNALTISNSTVAANTSNLGAVSSTGSLTLSASLLAHNGTANCLTSGPFTDGGYNLEDDPAHTCELNV
ncbi:MAG: hypothetical protein JO120_08050, partial [Solirubrobacterales bacterium]|nr:hypothetical protein [Solirubrobacterales bacterium]